MKRYTLICLGLGLGLVGAACARVSPTATPLPPTSTPTIIVVPTLPPATLVPTLAASPTPLPPTSVFTPEPTPPPTPDPNLGVGEVVYEDNFDGANWGWFYTDNIATFSLANGRLNAVGKVANSWRMTSGPTDLQLTDQQIRVTAYANLCYTTDEYGVAFRYNPDANTGYVFKFSCEGRARLEKVEGQQQPGVVVEWQAYPPIVAGAPAENALLIWAAGDQFHFYANDKYLFSATDKTFTSGSIAFYIRDRNAGGASVSFAGLAIKSVTAP